MTAIKGVSERLSDVDEVEMEGVSHSTSMSSTMSGPSSDDFSAKFSVQGTSSSKSTGKRKVVCIVRIKNYVLIVIFFNSLLYFRLLRILNFLKYLAKVLLVKLFYAEKKQLVTCMLLKFLKKK